MPFALRRFGLAQLPEDLTKDAEPSDGIGGGKAETANEAANFEFAGFGCGGVEVAGVVEQMEEQGSDAFEFFGRGGGGGSETLSGGLRTAAEFVKADGDGLAQVDGTVLFARRNAQKPVAVTHVFIREAKFF